MYLPEYLLSMLLAALSSTTKVRLRSGMYSLVPKGKLLAHDTLLCSLVPAAPRTMGLPLASLGLLLAQDPQHLTHGQYAVTLQVDQKVFLGVTGLLTSGITPIDCCVR